MQRVVRTVKPEEAGQRLDRFLARWLPHVPVSLLQKLVRQKDVRIRGQPGRLEPRQVLEAHQEVVVSLIPQYLPQNLHDTVSVQSAKNFHASLLPTLYCDPHVRVVDKPAGLAMHAGSGIAISEECVVDRLPPGEFPVHRLDRPTSGALVVARTLLAARALGSLFANEQNTDDSGAGIEKEYWAITQGIPTPREGTIDVPIGKRRIGAKFERVVASQRNSDSVQPASTRYKVLEVFQNRFGLLSLIPITGRKHQLRAHCADVLQCPIMGDAKFGATRESGFGPNKGAIALHARRVTFPHPIMQGTLVDVVVPLPESDSIWRIFDAKS